MITSINKSPFISLLARLIFPEINQSLEQNLAIWQKGDGRPMKIS
jgi:hypothetical protein